MNQTVRFYPDELVVQDTIDTTQADAILDRNGGKSPVFESDVSRDTLIVSEQAG